MNNNSKAAAKRTQVVYSEPRRKLVSSITKTRKDGTTYIVNRYKDNPNAKPIKTIVHATISADKENKGFNCFNRFKNR